MPARLESMRFFGIHRVSAGGWLLLAAAFLIGGSIVLSAFTIWRLRMDAIVEAEGDAHRIGVLVAEQTDGSMQAIDLVLQQERTAIYGAGVNSAAEFNDVFGTRWAHESLVRELANVPQAEAIILVGADGHVLNSTRGWPAGQIDIADLSHFQYLRGHEHSGPYISEPMINRSTGTATIYLSRRVAGRDGAFLGIVQAAIRIQYFDGLCGAVALSPGTGITLLRRDGRTLARCPTDAPLLQYMPKGSPWYAIASEGGGTYRTTGWLGPQSLFVSVHPLRDFPLVVDATVSEDVALAAWRREAALIGFETAAGIVCILVLLRALIMKFRHLEEARATVVEKSHLLETTLEHMDQGLIMLRHDRHIGTYNTTVLRMLDLPDALMRGTPHIDEILSFQRQAGEFAADDAVGAFIASTDAWRNLNAQPLRYERRRPDGRQLEVRTVPMADGGFVRTFTDITDRKAAEERIRYLAEHDELTGLANRSVLRDRLTDELARDRPRRCTAVLCLDLDDFKSINDTLGHAAGDALLRLVGSRLRATAGRGDVVARLGGDEFAIVQTHIAGAADAHALARHLAQAFAVAFEFESHLVPIGVSIGVAIGPSDGDSAETLLKNADIALYRAKADTQTCYRFFEPAMDVEVQERRALELDLRRALNQGEFELHFQPELQTRTCVLSSFEALLRWRHPARGIVMPGEFIALAEEVGLIVPIGEWAVREACRQATLWPHDIGVAVNLSALQICSPGLVQTIGATLAETGLAPERLELEITESVLLHDTAATMETLHGLRGLGVRIALDDFGTGYSSLGYLRSFPFDRMKIDRCFVRELHAGSESLSIIRAILALGQALGMDITAEGVETEEQFVLLQAEQCTHVQGHLFSMPQPAAAIPALLERYGAAASLRHVAIVEAAD